MVNNIFIKRKVERLQPNVYISNYSRKVICIFWGSRECESQFGWLEVPTKIFPSWLFKLEMEWIVVQEGFWIKMMLKLNFVSRIMLTIKLFFWTFCEKILISLIIMLGVRCGSYWGGSPQNELGDERTCGTTLASAYVLRRLSATWSQLQMKERSPSGSECWMVCRRWTPEIEFNKRLSSLIIRLANYNVTTSLIYKVVV